MQSQKRLQLCEFLSDVNTHSHYINIPSARKRGARLSVKNQNGGYHPVAVEFGLLCIRAFVQRQGDPETRVGRLKSHTYDAIETTLRNEFCFGYSQWLNPHSNIHFIRAPLRSSDDKTPSSFCNFYLSEQTRYEAAEVAFDLVFDNIKMYADLLEEWRKKLVELLSAEPAASEPKHTSPSSIISPVACLALQKPPEVVMASHVKGLCKHLIATPTARLCAHPPKSLPHASLDTLFTATNQVGSVFAAEQHKVNEWQLSPDGTQTAAQYMEEQIVQFLHTKEAFKDDIVPMLGLRKSAAGKYNRVWVQDTVWMSHDVVQRWPEQLRNAFKERSIVVRTAKRSPFLDENGVPEYSLLASSKRTAQEEIRNMLEAAREGFGPRVHAAFVHKIAIPPGSSAEDRYGITCIMDRAGRTLEERLHEIQSAHEDQLLCAHRSVWSAPVLARYYDKLRLLIMELAVRRMLPLDFSSTNVMDTLPNRDMATGRDEQLLSHGAYSIQAIDMDPVFFVRMSELTELQLINGRGSVSESGPVLKNGELIPMEGFRVPWAVLTLFTSCQIKMRVDEPIFLAWWNPIKASVQYILQKCFETDMLDDEFRTLRRCVHAGWWVGTNIPLPHVNIGGSGKTLDDIGERYADMCKHYFYAWILLLGEYSIGKEICSKSAQGTLLAGFDAIVKNGGDKKLRKTYDEEFRARCIPMAKFFRAALQEEPEGDVSKMEDLPVCISVVMFEYCSTGYMALRSRYVDATCSNSNKASDYVPTFSEHVARRSNSRRLFGFPQFLY